MFIFTTDICTVFIRTVRNKKWGPGWIFPIAQILSKDAYVYLL